jgi:hypothetical protein
LQSSSLIGMAEEHAHAFHLLEERLQEVERRMQITREQQERGNYYASTTR